MGIILNFKGKFYSGVLTVKVVKELGGVFIMLDHDKGVVYFPKPTNGANRGGEEGLFFEMGHVNFREDGGEWGTHG